MQEQIEGSISENERLSRENDRLRKALEELVSMVRGEASHLSNEDSGGDAELSIEIDDLLQSNVVREPSRTHDTQQPKT